MAMCLRSSRAFCRRSNSTISGGFAGDRRGAVAALDAGAEDVVSNEDGSVEVLSPPADFIAVKDALEKAGFKAEFSEVTMKPLTETPLAGEDAVRMQKLLDVLDGLDDVQEVYTTAVMDDAE